MNNFYNLNNDFNNMNNANIMNNMNIFNNFNNDNNMNTVQNMINNMNNINDMNKVNYLQNMNNMNNVNYMNNMNNANYMNNMNNYMNNMINMNCINNMDMNNLMNFMNNIINNQQFNLQEKNLIQFFNYINSFNNNNMNCLDLYHFLSNFQNMFNNNPTNNDNMNINYKNQNNIMLNSPHKVGLQNIGQSCYMNATLQCLINIKSLTNYLLSIFGNYDMMAKPLSFVYTHLISQIFSTKEKYISPDMFKTIIGELNPLFKGNHAADSKDLVFFIIEKLHKELNQENNNFANYNIQKDYNKLELEARDEKLMFNNFMNDFNSKNNSIISKIFYGIMRTTLTCQRCNTSKYSFQAFNIQIFQLKKIKIDKMNEMGTTTSSSFSLNLYDAFFNQQIPEYLTGDNMIHCNRCKCLTNGIHQQVIYNMPSVLILILNRGKNNQDFNEEFSFPPIIDFSELNIIHNMNNCYKKFYLCGIITHLGESGVGGHFISYCRNSSTSKFVLYNDAIVINDVSVENALSSNITQNESEKKTPYILFYHYF
jgi:ubiquitin C-terminal hydrolase